MFHEVTLAAKLPANQFETNPLKASCDM